MQKKILYGLAVLSISVISTWATTLNDSDTQTINKVVYQVNNGIQVDQDFEGFSDEEWAEPAKQRRYMLQKTLEKLHNDTNMSIEDAVNESFYDLQRKLPDRIVLNEDIKDSIEQVIYSTDLEHKVRPYEFAQYQNNNLVSNEDETGYNSEDYNYDNKDYNTYYRNNYNKKANTTYDETNANQGFNNSTDRMRYLSSNSETSQGTTDENIDGYTEWSQYNASNSNNIGNDYDMNNSEYDYEGAEVRRGMLTNPNKFESIDDWSNQDFNMSNYANDEKQSSAEEVYEDINSKLKRINDTLDKKNKQYKNIND